MTKKVKLSDAAKDLSISSQDIIDYFAGKGDNKKKASTGLSEDEMNLVLEHFSKLHEVSSFDEYFASKDDPAPERKKPAEEKKPAEKKPAEKKPAEKKPAEKKPAEKKQEAPKKEERPAAAPKKQESKPAAEAPKKKPQEQPVHRAEEKKPEPVKAAPKAEPVKEAPKAEPVKEAPKAEPVKEAPKAEPVKEAPKAEPAKAAPKAEPAKEAPKSDKQQDKKKDKKKEQAKAQDRGERTKFTAAVSSETAQTSGQRRTVDTRGSYVDLDKYNERYEQIAPANKHKNDNYSSKKQKINQKSQQRTRQQFSRKESEAEKLKRLELERARKQQLKVMIPDAITVGELATRLKVTATEVIKKLMGLGVMASINQEIDFDTASLVAEELGAKVEKEVIVTIEERLIDDSDDDDTNLQPRCPVVVVMGHVDHGKTSILDRIRNAHVAAGEAGGITQHIGAYQVNINGQDITFLDTPGHEAFTAMRSRGAQATDVVILIVAADDGVMPKTVEAINHAKAANVPIIVAINKIDKPTANPAKVKNELLKYEIVAEELGGENLFVEISAKQRINIEGLLEAVLLQVEMMDLKADPTKPAEGIVIESRMDLGKGPVATVLVKDGTLKIGDMVVTGASIGFVRSMMDWTGKRVKEASPSMAVEITGLDTVPPAGEKLYVFKDERKAKGLVELRINKMREKKNVEKATPSIEEFFAAEQEEVKDLNVIVKGDVDGSVEAIIASLNKIEHKKMKIKVIHSGVGGINENDVLLASASKGLIIGFNVRVDNKAKQLAAAEGVNIEIFSIIYELIDAIKAAMSGMLAPIIKEEFIGKLEVREIFKVGKVGTIAGCMVIEGRVVKASKIKLVRDNVVIYSGKLGTLKRFKDDVKEVKSGYECGATIDSYNDIKVGDIIECYIDKEFKDEVL
ncbi:MAG: translation initiation factor IF-2 [Lachnospiraceae bacterium]|nr:translation initiation factor IF-2 [Lachnospiraceae bacterium]